MMIKIFAFCIILTFIKAYSAFDNCNNDESSNDTMKNPQQQVALLGPDTLCFFSYGLWAKTSSMREIFSNAVRSGIARLPNHRLDFDYPTDEKKGSLPRIIPDCGYEVWGAIFTITVRDLGSALSKGDGLVGNGSRDMHLEQKILLTNIDGNITDLICNAFQENVLPEKVIYGLPIPKYRRPTRQTLDNMIAAYKDAGIPSEYIREVSLLPTKD